MDGGSGSQVQIVDNPGADELVLSTLPLHLILHLLHDATIDLQYIPVSERVSAIWPKERPIPSSITNGQEDKIKTHLNRKLILASTYEIPSSIEDNRNSRTYALKIGENRMMFCPRNQHR